ncbi:hypothetical protein [Williamsoniiplasma luminosum]|uniref:DUF5673 domain-containing protein n=1 Tax=Williamsoniiplasma luminosum TaxID=214888 RepID=A0A2S0NJH2_9MOLU|nr:hypothetical protein [Williamsoniiplasma luminosum]AVP49152.1 MAG: hypothetical protein C5T88_00955 [Williamsoniiplasma luminosum]
MNSIAISTFVLTIVIFIITSFFLYKTTNDIFQLKKFQQQEVVFWENRKMWSIHWIIICCFVSFFLVITTIFIVHVANTFKLTAFNWIIGSFSIGMITFSIFIILFERKLMSGIVFIFKNNNLVFLDSMIPVQELMSIENDLKRKWIVIMWKDQEVIGNIEKAKIRYNYKIKDLIKELNIPNKFD